MRRGFTLIELLVVITIILIASAVTVPMVYSSYQGRGMSQSARLLQSALAGCRDSALKTNSPSGIRLIADPAFQPQFLPSGQIDQSQPLAFSGWIPIEPGPAYSEGAISFYPADQGTYPAIVTNGLPALVAEESPGRWIQQTAGGPFVFYPSSPANWFWNIRVGEKVQFNGAGPWYTVCGPMAVNGPTGNPEGFVNAGPPAAGSPYTRTQVAPDNSQGFPTQPQFLLLVNGIDDDKDGYIDDGYDGVNNNCDPLNLIDEFAEWETETWRGQSNPQLDQKYTILRRPIPISGARSQSLSTNILIDATTWAGTRSRSRLPVDATTGTVELMIRPDGAIQYPSRYGIPTAIGMDASLIHFWLSSRSDVATGNPPVENWYLVSVTARTGRCSSIESPDLKDPFAAAQQGER